MYKRQEEKVREKPGESRRLDSEVQETEVQSEEIRRPGYLPDYRPNDSWGTGVVTKKDERSEYSWFIRWENNLENGDWGIVPGIDFLLFKCH